METGSVLTAENGSDVRTREEYEGQVSDSAHKCAVDTDGAGDGDLSTGVFLGEDGVELWDPIGKQLSKSRLSLGVDDVAAILSNVWA